MPATSISATSDPAAVRRRLLRWYRSNGRHALPWRLTRDPYAVLVSEVMLQQTQVERVLPYYTRWLARWPRFADLAAASPAEVIREWRGLGYNRRALNLHRLAVAVAQGGLMAHGPLTALPGIGPYTESALRCFAWDEAVPVADTNIARVIARLLLGAPAHRVLPARAITSAARDLLPKHGARDHNLALMDLGSMVCTARSPRCGECPVAQLCAWRANGYPPAPGPNAPAPRFEATARFARGRIIDALREAPATAAELSNMLPQRHRERTAAYLAALERDGLVVAFGEAWALPS